MFCKLLTFNISSSLLLIKSRKNNKDEIKKTNGKISNKVEGALENVKKNGIKKLTFKFSKKEISSKIFKTIINDKKTNETLINFLRNFFIKYFL